MDISLLDLSSAAGLVATVVLTANFLLGMMLGTAYRKSWYWKKAPPFVKRIPVADVHNWTAYVALAVAVVHPLLLVVDKTSKFTLVDVLFPLHAPNQRLFVALGALAFYALVLVVLTSQDGIRKRMGFRAWKNVHLISYATALLFVVHGVVMDPLLKDRPVDFFDAEKVLSEGCALLLLVATWFRFRYQMAKRNALAKQTLAPIGETGKR
ncbi:ferric reductase-like transmembrane domain-containing protein [Hymenobacter sp. BT770]|uniref:ferric reductase-like transmembrane domain-containing protein n=1 Tax=Hymenobacter sp. BT770 TaxID=2886942 RepID=UPI001D126AF9|nr:ferric reductase-like transmembrane domain-containing protein [Hymenobacter sp. BT770]MCC3152224.1 ferric reductase-like transmembrane domain-containing protein [Hymenobacter sp. BT770]MDO3414038.1 ferric reductase-like transmembrane domain-containing protein [Hymenobacter sp. BT770]